MEGPRWINNWRQDATKKIEELRNQWRRQRELQDLDIETSPIESKFSKDLLELMRLEEVSGAKGNYQEYEMISQRVNNQLKTETTRHYNKQVEVNLKKLNSLFRQQVSEREQFVESVQKQCHAICECAQTPMTDEETLKQRMELPMRRSDMEAFAAEERRLWRIAQQDMPKAERFHILNAFSLQLERVEAEWGAHEQQMATDFQARKRAIEGRDQDVEKSVVHAPVGRWKSKEKQSRLIHTAPIQEPSTPNIPSTTPCSEHSQSSTVGVRSSQSRSEIENQLRELERSFGAAKMRMEFEKQIAIGFIHRQSLRMNCQIDSMAKWKDKIAQVPPPLSHLCDSISKWRSLSLTT